MQPTVSLFLQVFCQLPCQRQYQVENLTAL